MVDEAEVRSLPPSMMSVVLRSVPAEELAYSSWEGLRDVCIGGMQDDRLSATERMQWATAGELVIDRQRHHPEKRDPHAVMANEVTLRAYVITRLGRVDDGSLSDLSLLWRRVTEAIGASSSSIRESAGDWQRTTRQEMLALRRVKNLVTPFREILPLLDQTDPLHEEIGEWVSVLPLLP
ncbi:hypothetical protein [Streptomyces sp. NPDC057702]|uniref:hypothetical protein n=1 Tax=unclassified Streptomyces TaxID=2593676 RepID=UPI00369CB52D